jgi:cell division protease FtsH
MARAMVTRMGFSDELGMVAYGDNQEEVFLGMSMGRQQSISESTAQKIDKEVKRLVRGGLRGGDAHPHRESASSSSRWPRPLLEYETLTGDEIKDLNLAGKPPVRDAARRAESRHIAQTRPATAIPVRPRPPSRRRRGSPPSD